MSEVATVPNIVCSKCGVPAPFDARFAGRRIRCACGGSIRMPLSAAPGPDSVTAPVAARIAVPVAVDQRLFTEPAPVTGTDFSPSMIASMPSRSDAPIPVVWDREESPAETVSSASGRNLERAAATPPAAPAPAQTPAATPVAAAAVEKGAEWEAMAGFRELALLPDEDLPPHAHADRPRARPGDVLPALPADCPRSPRDGVAEEDPFSVPGFEAGAYCPAADPPEAACSVAPPPPNGGRLAKGAVPVVVDPDALVDSYRAGALARKSRVRRQSREDRVKDYYLPIGMVMVGLFLTFVEAGLFLGRWRYTLSDATTYVVGITLINLTVLLVVMIAANRLLDMGMEGTGPAILKVLAIAILPAGIAGVVRESMGTIGYVVAWGIASIGYWVLLRTLLGMEFPLIAVATTILWLIRNWLATPLFLALYTPVITMHPHLKSTADAVYPAQGAAVVRPAPRASTRPVPQASDN